MITLTLRNLRNSSLLQAEVSPLLNHHLLSQHISRRHASTAPPSKPISSVNGPPSTLPAPLIFPTRSPDQSLPGYLFALGKASAIFYKTGVKNIYANYKASRPLQQALDTQHSASFSKAISAGAFTRADFQLLHRNYHDLKRVPIFGLVFLICGEFTPLVVIAFSNVVPWTCRIPKQIRGDRAKLEERRGISFRNLTMTPPSEAGVGALERQQLIHISWSLGLSSRIWDWLGGTYPGLPNGVLRKKVQRRVEYLGLDDRLIKDGGGVGEMVVEELRMACVERGINILERSASDLRRDLNSWLTSAAKMPIERLLLTRPSIWISADSPSSRIPQG